MSDTGNAIRNRDARQAAALTEGISANAGDRIAFNSIGDLQFPSGSPITVCDGDHPTSRGPCQVI